MPLNSQCLARSTAAMNEDFTINYATGVGTSFGAVNEWMYNAAVAGDSQATVAAAGYFTSLANLFQIGDLIFVWDNAATGQFYTVTAVTYPGNTANNAAVVTISAFGAAIGVIGTANIANLAVTTAKLALLSVTSAQIAANTITNAQIAANTLTSATLALNTIQFVTATYTAAQWNAISGVPVQLVVAQGANTVILPIMGSIEIQPFGAAFTGGGAAQIQWGNTAAAAGSNALSATVAAAFFTGAAAAQQINVIGGFASTLRTANTNLGLFVTNAAANFGGGAGSSVIVNCSYMVTAD
jgi:hypothetical protein